jgi:hypothetical protein
VIASFVSHDGMAVDDVNGLALMLGGYNLGVCTGTSCAGTSGDDLGRPLNDLNEVSFDAMFRTPCFTLC